MVGGARNSRKLFGPPWGGGGHAYSLSVNTAVAGPVPNFRTGPKTKYAHTHNRFTAPLRFCPGLPGWAGTRKVKPIWIYWSNRL